MLPLELIAWIIGWALIMEYAIGNITVAISWMNLQDEKRTKTPTFLSR
jgi:amino acid transporter